jgi:uncharacterized protein YdhG (YjbR/CyaY superfamily)
MDVLKKYLAGVKAEFRPLVRQLDAVIRESAPALSAGLKWGNLTYHHARNVCSLVAHQDHVNLQVWGGAGLPDPARLLVGTGKAMRHIPLMRGGALNRRAIAGIVRAAAAKAPARAQGARPAARSKSAAVDAYIAACEPTVQKILRKIRATIHNAAPGAQEAISYRMPAFVLDGHLVYIGAFRRHLGLFPPVRDAKLKRACANYAGPKGNLQFLYDEPIPYALIARIVAMRVQENRARIAARKR